MKNSGKNFFTWIVIFFIVITVSNMIGGDGMVGRKLVFSDFIKKVEAQEVLKVEIVVTDE